MILQNKKHKKYDLDTNSINYINIKVFPNIIWENAQNQAKQYFSKSNGGKVVRLEEIKYHKPLTVKL